jgi:hypothetical protein
MERARAGAGDGGGHSWLELPLGGSCGLGEEPFQFRHRLAPSDGFSAEAVAELCDQVPRSWISNHDADRGLVTPRGTVIDDARPVGDVVRNLEGSCNWLVVRHLEHVPPYKGLLDLAVEQAARTLDDGDGRTLDRGATIFIASPGAVVPVHIDRHHNFLLQITGTKEFAIGSFEDSATQAREIERNFGPRPTGSHLVPTRHTVFRLGPGDGVYIPAYAFHWVTGGLEASVAFSCAFRTELTERIELAHEFNAFLSRLRLPARAPTGSGRDRLKASVVRLRRRVSDGPSRSS